MVKNKKMLLLPRRQYSLSSIFSNTEAQNELELDSFAITMPPYDLLLLTVWKWTIIDS